MTDAKTIDNDGERMVPEFHRPSLMYSEHVNRYLAALDVVRDKRVLDIASGSGYGSQLLAGSASSVVGVDVSPGAVAYASTEHGGSNLEFRVGDAENIPVDDASIDVVVTFETIEHVADYERFVAEIDRVLAPGGVALISTPNDLEFIEGNHFHLHEFVYDELMELVGRHFSFVRPYFQATWKAVAIGTEEGFGTEGPVPMHVTNLAPLERDQFLYFYLVCAREPVDVEIPTQLALGGHYSDRRNQEADLAMIAANDALTARVREVEDERDALATDLATIRGTRSYRASRSLARLAHLLGRRPRA